MPLIPKQQPPYYTTEEIPTSPGILATEITLTDAQIKALQSADIELIPAPGIGKYIYPIQVSFSLNNTAGIYTNLSINNPPQIWYRTSEIPIADSTLDDFAFGTPDKYGTLLLLYQSQTGYYSTEIENTPIDLNMANSGAGNLTGGNTANYLKIKILYTIITM